MRQIEIPEMILVISEDDDIIGEMHIAFVNENVCRFVADDMLKKALSYEEILELKERILEKLQSNWSGTKIELEE